MFGITGRNVHEILPEAIRFILMNSVQRDSRNGPVRVAIAPVVTHYQRPVERVLYWPLRDANPFFHLLEALWMIAGRNDVAFPSSLVSTMNRFSSDGVSFHGAYGYRWRVKFGFDQLLTVAERLRANHEDRRQVVQMYDARADLGANQEAEKDIPCNLTITFQVNHRKELDMVVFNRSNDIIWGCYGANAVHFSVLQEYMAARIGVAVGGYWQVSANWHAYLNTLDPLRSLADETTNEMTAHLHRPRSPYESGNVVAMPLVSDPNVFDQEVRMLCEVEDAAIGYREPFIRRVAMPMLQAYRAFQNKENPDRFRVAHSFLGNMPEGNDWQLACRDWLLRREDKLRRAQDDGPIHN